MIVQANAVMRRPGAQPIARRRAPPRAGASFRSPTMAVGARRRFRPQDIVGALKLAAGAFAGAAVTIAILNYRDTAPDDVAFERARNETVVYRQDRQDRQAYSLASAYPQTEQIEVSDDLDDDGKPVNYPRAVQTVSFVNPQAPGSISTLTAAARQSIKQALIKVGGFVAFTPREKADKDEPIAPRPRTGSIMDEVDDYLWEVYQRTPVKKDGTGDFTWKDPAAAKNMHVALRDYVIGGMDPEFREQLYHAGKAMDAAGLQWSMLSAFRDDYRQRLASGFKASVGNSLHGGSRRTGGYGHGRAIDITSFEGEMSDVWHWIDEHGARYGLNRPMPGADPAHIQQRGDWHKIAMTLREQRLGSAQVAKAGPSHTKVAKASSR